VRSLHFARSSLVTVVILGLLVATTVLVRYTGGANGAATNFYYIPIIVSAVAFGDLGAIICALLAGYLAGPFMPWAYAADGTRIDQTWLDMGIRLLFFFILGVMVSRLTDRARRRADELASLFQVARAVNSSIRIDQVLQLIVSNVRDIMRVKGVGIRLLGKDAETGDNRLGRAISEGLSHEYLSKGPVVVGDSPVDQQVIEGTEVVQIRDVRRSNLLQYQEALLGEGIRSILVLPLIAKGNPIGVFRIYRGAPHRHGGDELRLVKAFAEEAALAIENAGLYESLKESYYETVRALTRALEARDEDQVGHAERVTDTIDALAQELGMSREECELLRFGATLHDIGKIGTLEPERSPRVAGGGAWDDRLDSLEFLHPIVGRSILEPVGFLGPVLPMVLNHHERYDGTGYPEGLAGEAIPLCGRMAKIANDYDLLVSGPMTERPRDLDEVARYFRDRSGSEYDPELVKAFVRVIRRGTLPGSPPRSDAPTP
jgi:GAF domain-containing protein